MSETYHMHEIYVLAVVVSLQAKCSDVLLTFAVSYMCEPRHCGALTRD